MKYSEEAVRAGCASIRETCQRFLQGNLWLRECAGHRADAATYGAVKWFSLTELHCFIPGRRFTDFQTFTDG